ncbi:hypothetical protein [Bradyrhizobium elkanii]|uniref:hypothetical protein n=1 Tax=Bradyrhizobium elkanii TaxID=29448 RepID=UPI003511DE29
MANFGIGFGAFAQGMNQGVGTGMKLRGAWDAKQLRDQRQATIDTAKKEYDKSIDAEVAAQPGIAPEQARSNATAKVGSFTDYLYGTAMPKLIDTYTQNGDLEGAETMRKWSADAKERKFMDSFGKTLGYWAAGNSSGDYTGFADSAVKLLNNGGYGIKATGYDLVKDGEGKTTGLTFKLKDGDNEFSHTFNSIDEAAKFLAAQGSPANRVKQWQAEQEAATKLKADMAKETMKAKVGLGKELAVEDAKQKGRIDLQKQKADDALHLEATKGKGSSNKEQEKDDYVISALKARGFGDDDVSAYFANKYLGGYRKGKSPQEFAQQVLLELTKDPMVTDKSPENLKRLTKGIVDTANEFGGASDGPRPKPGAAPAPSRNIPVYR